MNKDNIIHLLLGIIIGIFFAAAGGVFLYKIVRFTNQPRTNIQKKHTQDIKKKFGTKGFYLSFEKNDDLNFFSPAEKTVVELSGVHVTHGKHSLMVKIKPDTDVPGILWDVFFKDVLNWEKGNDFHFDVYNSNEDYVDLGVRLKSGKDYPKEIFSDTVELKPLQMNHVKIPMNEIAGSCDIKEMSYIKLFVQSPKKEIVLFFDNMGIREPTKEDEASDIKKEAVVKDRPKPKEEELKEGFDIFVATSLDRIFQNGQTLVKPLFSNAAGISLAKNEYESFQIVVSNGRDALKATVLQVSDFIDESTGAKLDSNNITWNFVGYVETKKPGYPVRFIGMWPDYLLPKQSTDINPGITQPFWVTVYIPKGTSSGIYKGEIKVVSGERQLGVIPVTIKVYDFTLPLESHLKTAFHVYGYLIPQRTPKKDKERDDVYASRIAEVTERYYIDMLKHRMNPILNIDPSSQEQLGKVDNYRRYGLNNFSVGKRSGTNDNNWPENDDELEKLLPVYRGYGETLKFNKMLDYNYIYAWDEGRLGNIRVKKVCSMLHRAYPGLKTMVCYHGIWDPGQQPGWGDDIDIWCFQIDSFNERKMQVLKDRGMEIWMYVSGPGDSGAPNLAIDFDSMDYRIIPWICWRYGIKGFLYWCVNWWPDKDPYKTAMNTPWQQNGNGLMYYPGEDGPIDSLRIEIFRDGMEDYEYLYLLAQKIQTVKDSGLEASNEQLIASAEELLNLNKTIAISMTSFTKDTQVLMERRQKIAEAIEQIGKLINRN